MSGIFGGGSYIKPTQIGSAIFQWGGGDAEQPGGYIGDRQKQKWGIVQPNIKDDTDSPIFRSSIEGDNIAEKGHQNQLTKMEEGTHRSL